MIFGVRVKIPKNKPATPVSGCIFTLTPNIRVKIPKNKPATPISDCIFTLTPNILTPNIRPVRKLVWDYD